MLQRSDLSLPYYMDPFQVAFQISFLDPNDNTMTFVVDVAEVGLVPSVFCGPTSSYYSHT